MTTFPLINTTSSITPLPHKHPSPKDTLPQLYGLFLLWYRPVSPIMPGGFEVGSTYSVIIEIACLITFNITRDGYS